MPNRLETESSLYLKQHGNNPVNWWPWCTEAFEVAKRENKLILISIGYSSCHWCHVMAHESFEDEYIAGLMNKNFVCIKVDREERPDIDQMFVEVVQMITGRAGWPLNVFCLPDGRPFFGGTYFPPKDIGKSIIPWPQLLMRIVEHYKKSPKELEENAENIIQNLQTSNNPSEREILSNDALLEGAKLICKTHDEEWGGFGQSPKFPSPTVLDYLFVVRGTLACEEDVQLSKRIDQVLITTLKGMAHGGIYDQIGGGFSRYSVDRFWVVPHFEKMLYDNGLLLTTYTKGWLLYHLELFKSIVEETIIWLLREMATGFGAFASSLDADTGGVEGSFYVWKQNEIIEALGSEEGRAFCEAYSITQVGNFEADTSVPVWVYDDDQKRAVFKPLREKLLRVRQGREQPGKDMKVLVSWNSLVAKGLVDAGFYFKRPEWIELACKTLDWIWKNMFDAENRLKSVYYTGGSQFNAYLDDYAFYAESCLVLASKIDWVKPGSSSEYIERARRVIGVVLEHFGDGGGSGFFFTTNDHEELIARKKYWWDQAIPAGNASLVHTFSELYALTGESVYVEKLNELRCAYAGLASNAPNGVAYALAGFAADATGVVILKISEPNEGVLNRVQEALAQKPYRKIFLLTNDKKEESKYQLCVGTQCLELTNDLGAVIGRI